MRNMIDDAKKSDFRLPLVLVPVIAFGLNLMGDYAGGTLAIALCDRFRLGGDATQRALLLSVAVNALILLFWVCLVERRNPKGLGLYTHPFGKDSLIGTLAGIGAMVCIVAAGRLLNVVSFQSINALPKNLLAVLLMLPCWFVQAGAEELLTRGWVLPTVSARSKPWIGIVVSSALFVLMHLDNAGLNPLAILNIFLIGVLLALYTLKSNSLWGAVFFHTFWNFMIGSFFGLSVSGGTTSGPNLFRLMSQGNSLLSGGAFGLEAGLLTTAATLILLGLLMARSAKEKH